MFTELANPFGTVAYEPAGIPVPSRTHYYKGMRLNRLPVRIPDAPKPLTHTVKNFLLNFNG